MLLQALVQGRFPFLGVMRNPGDVITAEELSLCTPQTRDALVGQKLIVLAGEDGMPVGGGAERFDHFQAQLDAMREAGVKRDAALEAMAERVETLARAFEKGGEDFQGQIDGVRTAIRSLAPRAPAAAPPKPAARKAPLVHKE